MTADQRALEEAQLDTLTVKNVKDLGWELRLKLLLHPDASMNRLAQAAENGSIRLGITLTDHPKYIPVALNTVQYQDGKVVATVALSLTTLEGADVQTDDLCQHPLRLNAWVDTPLFDAIADLAPERDSGIDSVTIITPGPNGTSATLTAEHGERARRLANGGRA